MSEKTTSYELDAGRYYVGDPCYVINERWHEYLDCWYEDEPFDGHPVAMFHTQYGDGVYRGSDGYGYSVDAGLIGVVPDALIEYPCEGQTPIDLLGSIVDFEEPFTCTRTGNGTLKFGHITIETGGTDDEEEEDDDWDEDDEFFGGYLSDEDNEDE